MAHGRFISDRLFPFGFRSRHHGPIGLLDGLQNNVLVGLSS